MKKLLLVTIFLLQASIFSIVADKEQHPANILKSTCSITRYPDLCVSTLALVPHASSKLSTPKNVIEMSLNLTILSVEHNYFTVKKLIYTRRDYQSPREKTALHDCLEMIDETLDELHKAESDIRNYPHYDNSSISEHVETVKILLSATMTNMDTCIDGFSHDLTDKMVRENLMKGQVHSKRMCSNVLAMIKNLTDEDNVSLVSHNHRDIVPSASWQKDVDGNEWPEWLSNGDRKLLQASTTVTPDVIVAADGTGDYRTVSAAVIAAPDGSSRRYIIKIKAGVYRENVDVTKKKTNIMFLGDGRTNTIITGHRNVVDGSTTFHSATVAIVGDRFLARDITFQNTAGPSKHQAVALRVGSDLSAFYRCHMLAYQDTLYVHSLRQFYTNCLIAGTVDFIFGNAAAVFQNCDIHARRPNPGQRNMVTAQGRDDPNQNTGIVIQKCRIGATSDLQAVKQNFPTYLGRPWKQYSRTVVMQSVISDIVDPAGWFEWAGSFALDTLYYGEYQNSGAGAGIGGRVKWKGFRVISSVTEAQAFTAAEFIGGGHWLGSTGFPFSLGL